MKDIVIGFSVLVTVTLCVGVIVGASAYLFFNWTPLTHGAFRSYLVYITDWRVFTSALFVFGAALFVRQVIVVLNRNE